MALDRLLINFSLVLCLWDWNSANFKQQKIWQDKLSDAMCSLKRPKNYQTEMWSNLKLLTICEVTACCFKNLTYVCKSLWTKVRKPLGTNATWKI